MPKASGQQTMGAIVRRPCALGATEALAGLPTCSLIATMVR